ncbi:GDSL-type esterase/lipase family protein [Shewanella amazonensis]|uniref:Lipolytic enzyme, G-D-S-L n=1 Tax=Shewanella amazonensis (strain ATCC BAA-1098 / SB2B) TaxID=326297 RepID=A1S8X6_SHEAM|nr:GDSL-type esterase/lipase family protein [Shewanella amazonensis]ABM00833.1 lipolytic enzyme, G-D-S-L [Shewanella amazonensis SB2B]
MRILSVFFILLFLSACGGPRLPFLGENARILAFGDSLTFGIGASDGMDYPAHLSRLCDCDVINAGVSGETTTEGLARLAELLDETQPDLLILLEGGNDILRNQDKAQLKRNLEAMIREAQGRQVPVLLIAVPDRKVFLSPLPLYQELAEQFSLPLLEDTLPQLLSQSAMKSDTVHLNDAGYQLLAEEIYQLASESGAF